MPGNRKTPKGGIDLLGRHAKAIGNRRGLDGIGDRLRAGNGKQGVDGLPQAKIERKDRAPLVINANVARTDLIVVRDARKHHVDARRRGKGVADERSKVVLATQNQQREKVAGGAHAANNLGFGTSDILAAAQNTDMGGADLGHNGKVGVGGLRHALNLVEMVHAHLEHQNLGVGRGPASTVSGIPIRLL